MPSFTITTPVTQAILGDQPAEFQVRLINLSGFTQTARVQIESTATPLSIALLRDGTAPVAGNTVQLDLKNNEEAVFTLRAAPAGGPVPPGSYRFNLLAVNTADPNGDVARSQPMSVVVCEKNPPPPVKPWMVFTAIGALIAIGGTIAILLALQGDPPPTPLPKLAMPKLVGLPLEQAQAAIRESTLRVGSINYKPDSAVPDSSVVSQDPPAEQAIEVASLVNLVVAQRPGKPPEGPVKVKVQLNDFTGQPFPKAVEALRKAQLRVATRTVLNPTHPEGIVLAQEPAAGTLLDPEAPVMLSISRRPTRALPPHMLIRAQDEFKIGVSAGAIKRAPADAIKTPTAPQR
jgi:hypothetical protein